MHEEQAFPSPLMNLLIRFPLAMVVAGSAVLTGAAQAAVDFKKEILPILEAKCVKCHQAERVEDGKTVKPKNELRLDAAWAMLKGGETKSHPALVPKNSAKSYMYEVVTLPKDDDMFMPPKGDPLTEAEVAKLKTWIDEGADFGGWEGNLTGKPAEAPAVAKAPPKIREHDVLYKSLAEGLQPATPEALKAAASTGAQISALMPGSPLLRADFLTGVSKCDDKSLTALDGIKANLVHLDLARTQVTDASLATLAAYPKLVRLDLRKTKITDKGLEALSKSRQLNYLNLFGTEVTDAGIASLASVKSLRDVFLFETKVTEAGVAKLKAALPRAEVVSDVTMPEPQAPAEGQKGRKGN